MSAGTTEGVRFRVTGPQQVNHLSTGRGSFVGIQTEQIYPNIDPCLMFLHGRSLTFCLCMMQISDLVFSGPDDQYFATSSADGVLHLWSKDSLEHLQFQVLEQVITKKTFCCISPSLTSCLSK